MSVDDLTNMDDFDRQLKKLLAQNGAPDPARADKIRKKTRQYFNEKQRKVDRIVTWYHVILGALLGFSIGQMAGSSGHKSLQIGIVAIIIVMGLVVMKLWYWIMNAKLGIMREIRLLRLDMAVPKNWAEKSTAGEDEDEGAESASQPPFLGSPNAAKYWKVGLVAIVLAAYIIGYLLASW